MRSAQSRDRERAPDRFAVRRRADEALVASYIHALSARHRAEAEPREAESRGEPERP